MSNAKLLKELAIKLRAVDRALSLGLDATTAPYEGKIYPRALHLEPLGDSTSWTVLIDDAGHTRTLIVKVPDDCSRATDIVALAIAAQMIKERCKRENLFRGPRE